MIRLIAIVMVSLVVLWIIGLTVVSAEMIQVMEAAVALIR